jgi:hypothetical protein
LGIFLIYGPLAVDDLVILDLVDFLLFRAKGFKSALIFDGIEEALKNDGANLVKRVKGIFGFKVKDTNGNELLWIVDAKNGNGKVELGGKGLFVLPGNEPI